MDAKVQQFVDMVRGSVIILSFSAGQGCPRKAVFPDFRSVDGFYNQKYQFPPEMILSHTFYEENTEEFYRFYRDKMLVLTAKPNMAHMKLAELEKAGKLKAVITQNIDGLHQAAGSKNVLELHGSIHRNYCTRCHKFFDAEYMLQTTGVPKCDACGAEIKPDVVLYEEGLDTDTIEAAVNYIQNADHAHHRRHFPGGVSRRRPRPLLPGPQAGAGQ
jgi:NAD-dependent deacetylase